MFKAIHQIDSKSVVACLDKFDEKCELVFILTRKKAYRGFTLKPAKTK